MRNKLKSIVLAAINVIVVVSIIISFCKFQSDRYSNTFSQGDFFSVSGSWDSSFQGYYIDENSGYKGLFTCGPYMKLDKGVYNVTVVYDTNTDFNISRAYDDDLSKYYNGLQSDTVNLQRNAGTVTYKIWLNYDAEYFEVQTYYDGKGYLAVKEIVIEESLQSFTYGASIALFALLILDVFMIYFLKKIKKCDRIGRIVLCVLTGVVFLAAAPVFGNGFEVSLGDGQFHMLRIEGIADSLRAGVFPVKIQPNWVNDYGYAISVFYGDAFLYFPAVLRLLGFTIELAYKLFIFALVIITVVVSYFSFKRIFKSRLNGVACCIFYSLCTSSLWQLHFANALGNYIALAFLPLLISGLYAVIRETEFKGKNIKLFLPIVISVTAIVNSHLPSVKTVVLFVVMFMICYWKEVFHKERFIFLVKSLLISIVLNAGFLIPFLDYYINEKVIATRPEVYMMASMYIQRWGHTLFSYITMPFSHTPTSALQIIMIPAFCGMLFCLKKEIVDHRESREWLRLGIVSTAIAVIALFMSNEVFPWDKLADLLKTKAHWVNEMMYPYRWGVISLVFLTTVAGIIIKLLGNIVSKHNLYIGVIMFLIPYVFVVFNFYNVVYPKTIDADERYHFYDTAVLPTDNLYGGQYLPEGTDWSQYVHNKVMASETVELIDYQKDGLQVEFTCINHADDGYIELPLTYYTGYKAIDAVTKEELKVAKGNNNVVSVQIPENYMGNVKVFFSAPMAWNISYVISFITAIGIVVVMIVNRKKERKNRIMEKQVTSC